MNDYPTKAELDEAIRFEIYQHRGAENAIDRWKLVQKLFGMDAINEMGESDRNTFDRKVRDGIERLRNQGHIICNAGDGEGYYIADTVDEYQKFRMKYGSHAFSVLSTIKAMDESAREKWPNPLQPSLFQ